MSEIKFDWETGIDEVCTKLKDKKLSPIMQIIISKKILFFVQTQAHIEKNLTKIEILSP